LLKSLVTLKLNEVVVMLKDMDIIKNMMTSHPMDTRIVKKEAIGEKKTIMGLVKVDMVVTDMDMVVMDMGMDMDTNMKPKMNMVTRKSMVVTTMAKKIMLPKKNMVVMIMARKKDMETNMDMDTDMGMDTDTDMDINTNKSMKRKITVATRKIMAKKRNMVTETKIMAKKKNMATETKIMVKKKNMVTETKIMAKKKDMATDTTMDTNTNTATKKNMARNQATVPVKNMDMDTIEDLMEDLMKIDITSTSFWTLMQFMGTSQDMEVDRMNMVDMEEDITTDHHTISMTLFTISLLVAGAILQFTLTIALILMALDKAIEEAIMEEPCPSQPIPTVLGQPDHLITGNPLNNPHLGKQDNKIGNKVHRLKPGPVKPKSKPKHQLGTLQLNYQPKLGPLQLQLNNQPRLGLDQLRYNKPGKAQLKYQHLNNNLMLKHHNQLNNKEKIGVF
jgi:hypothetical protein